MKLIAEIVFLFYMTPSIKKSLHMFQQNRYRRDRYVPWLRQQLSIQRWTWIKNAGLLCLVYGLFFVSPQYLPRVLLGILMVMYGALALRKESMTVYRKPLVMTARAKRLCAWQVLLLSIVVWFLLQCSIYWHIFFTPYLQALPWLSVLAANAIAYPFEAVIQRSYMEKAENKLRACFDLAIIAITGSYGKTSVKNMLYRMLQDRWLTLATPQSYNNRMGITKTILEELQPLHEVFLCEMGADHVHEIEELMRFVKPRYGIVTAVGPQHLATFHTMENILHEKMQMIEQLDREGIGFLNADNEWIRSYPITASCAIVWFGKDSMADYRYDHVVYDKNGTKFTITHHKETHAFQTKLLGEHAILDITCAIAVAHTLSIDWDQLQECVKRLPSTPHRLEKKSTQRYTILDDAYNANPYGARCALDVIKVMAHQRIIITPGLIDLGDIQEHENEQLGIYMADCVDEVILVGLIQTQSIKKGLGQQGFPSAHIHSVNAIQEAFALLQQIARDDAVVLIENDLPDAFNH